jgi:hypothetical protein
MIEFFLFIEFVVLCYWLYDYNKVMGFKTLIHDKQYGKIVL